MGQLSALTWKNFCWLKRHPVQTGFFYLFPAVIAGLLYAAIKFSKSDTVSYTKMCRSNALPLFPNHRIVMNRLFCLEYSVWECATGDDYVSRTSPASPHLALTGADWSVRQCAPGNRQMNPEPDTPTPGCYSFYNRHRPQPTYDVDYFLVGALVYFPNDAKTNAIVETMNAHMEELLLTPDAFEGISRMDARRRYQRLMGPSQNRFPMERRKRQAGLGLGKGRGQGRNSSGADGSLGGDDELGFEAFYAKMLEDGTADVNVSRCALPLWNRTYGFDKEADAIQFVRDMNTTNRIAWGIIHFTDTSSNFQYKLIVDEGMRQRKATLYLQSLIESSIVEEQTGTRIAKHVQLQGFPSRCRKEVGIYRALFELVSFLLVLCMIGVSTAVPAEMCSEKAAGLVEILLIAGVSRLKLKLSWLIFGATLGGSLVLFNCIFLMVGVPTLLEATDFALLFVFLVTYAAALICFTFVLASLFSSGDSAASGCALILMLAYFVPSRVGMLPDEVAGIKPSMLLATRLASLLVPSVAVQIGVKYFFEWEMASIGAGWHNLFESPIDNDGYMGVGEAWLYLLLQIPLHTLISVYLDKINPGKYGIRLPFYFLLMPSYWRSTEGTVDEGGKAGEPEKVASEGVKADIEQLEETKDNVVGIAIHELVKTYGSFKAVNNLTINFYKSEVTAFLGHNGAGKSTTMNILTGMLTASSGDALVENKSVRTHMGEIRKNLGYCPQYDIVYPTLTVAEHMSFFGSLKGIDKKELADYRGWVFETMKMNQKSQQNTIAKNLSGGMKRKLSIALAFMGSPSTVILDEPTSAIDPFSRRAIWDVILHYRTKATILLSTHHMQEADMLGDRIAIIDSGMLKCFGTSMYLKSRYGKGFAVTCAHIEPINARALEETLSKCIPVTLKSTSDTETVFSVQMDEARSEKMIQAFQYLEQNAEETNVVSFGISEATIEQVFLTVTTHGTTEQEGEEDKNMNFAHQTSNPEAQVIKPQIGISLLLSQMVAMLLKRILIAKRDPWNMFLSQFFWPPFAVIVLLLVANVDVSNLFGEAENIVYTENPWRSGFSPNRLFYYGDQQSNFSKSLQTHSIGSACTTERPIEGKTCSSAVEFTPPLIIHDMSKITACVCLPCPLESDLTSSYEANLPSGDLLVDISNWSNVTDYLEKTSNAKMIGGFEEFTIVNKSFAAEMAFGSGPMDVAVLWAGQMTYDSYSKQGHMLNRLLPAVLNSYYNVELRAILLAQGQQTAPVESFAITLSIEERELYVQPVVVTQAMVLGMLLALVLPMVIANSMYPLLLLIVPDRFLGIKQLQFLMGLRPVIYWSMTFLWDFAMILLSLGIMLALINAYPKNFSLPLDVFSMSVIIYSTGMLLFCYVIGYMVKKAKNAYNLLIYFVLLSYITALVFGVILKILMAGKWWVEYLFLLNVLPPYYMVSSMFEIVITPNATAEVLLVWDKLGRLIALQLVWTIVMVTTIVLTEMGVLSSIELPRRKKTATEPIVEVAAEDGAAGEMVNLGAGDQHQQPHVRMWKDADVAREEHDVLSSDSEHRLLLATSVEKRYGTKPVVRGVSFGVKTRECFGLLSVNGAGKSTLFRMLTGVERTSGGSVRLLGKPIWHNYANMSQHISYCPQENVLYDQLTVVEHLHLYGRIRGIPTDQRTAIIAEHLAELGLDVHAAKKSQQLSGGNKRKLNFAISIMTRPDIIYLDEVSTGMDPGARRAAWGALQQLQRQGCAAVVTTHSMEEAEALSNRLVVMVNGQFRCIGGVQYLKDKFGNTYNVKVRLAPDSEVVALEQRFKQLYPDLKTVEQRAGFLELQIPSGGLRLSELYALIHQMKTRGDIQDFSVSQTTLEHVFVNMAKDQA